MKPRFCTNIYLATLYHLSAALLVIWLTRIFFYLYNADLLAGLSAVEFRKVALNGLHFDIPALLYLNILFITMRILPFGFVYKPRYEAWCAGVYYACNGVGIAANLMDTPFYRFTNTRTTAQMLTEFVGDANAGGIMLGHFRSYWYLFLVFALFLALLVWLYRRAEVRPMRLSRAADIALRCLMVPVAYGLVIIGVRGNLIEERPTGVSHAVRYVTRNGDIPLVLNTPFSLIRTIGKDNAVDKLTYFSEETARSIFDPYYPAKADAVASGKNVVTIILEGIGASFLRCTDPIECDTVRKPVLMPFLEGLAAQSRLYNNAYATGRRSVEGINAIMGGFPMFPPNIFMQSRYMGNDIDGLGGLLGPEGYASIFYHGCNRGSYGLESFSKATGTERFVGRDEYGDDSGYDHYWGIYDDRMADFIISDLSATRQPFVATWFTLSSHLPFSLPKEFEGRYRSPDRTMEQMVEYVDDVLETMFAKASETDWFSNTVFIITADHGPHNPDAIYNSPYTRYKVPLIIYTPDGSVEPSTDSLAASQLDIVPTVLGLLGYGKPHVSMGADLFDASRPRFAVIGMNGTYQMVQDSFTLLFDGDKSVALYDKERDPQLTRNIIDEHPKTAQRMETLLKAFLQEYTHRLNENRLSARNSERQSRF